MQEKQFQISIKIDKDIEEYTKDIQWIVRKTRTQYINDLIRNDMNNIDRISAMKKEIERIRQCCENQLVLLGACLDNNEDAKIDAGFERSFIQYIINEMRQI